MDESQIKNLLTALTAARKGKESWHWGLVLEAGDGRPALFASKSESTLDRALAGARKTAKDARFAEGIIRIGEDKAVTFVKHRGSAPAPDAQKAIQKKVSRLPGLEAARGWLDDAPVVEEEEVRVPQQPPEGEPVRPGIRTRETVEARSRATKDGEKKYTDYVRFLEGLEGWHREFGDGIGPGDLGRARASLDELEAAALRWRESHPEKRLESRKNKRRRSEVEAVLQEVAEARRMLVTLTTRDGTTDEDWERLDELEQAWMEERIEENALEYLEWGSECQDRLDEGKYKQGRELGAGTFGRVVLLEDEEQGGTLVAKFQTHRGKMTDPKNLETEAGNYEKIGPHPNIVRCLGVMDVDGEQALVLDSVAGGSWSSYIQDGARWVQEGKISPVEYAAGLQQILRGLVRGLVHMHGKGWHHNDIKPDNVMIDPRTGEAVIIDLGTMYSSGFLHQTPAYRDGSSRGTSDREGVGMSTFEAIVGALPNFRPERMEEDPNDFQSRGFQAKRNFWERQERMFELGKGDDPRSGLVQMIGAMHDFANRLMDPDPQKRPALGELLHLPFLTDSILSEEESRDVLKRMPDLRGN